MRIASADLVQIDSVRLSNSRCHVRRMRLSTLGPLFGLLGQLVSDEKVLLLRLRMLALRRKSCGTFSGTSKVSTNFNGTRLGVATAKVTRRVQYLALVPFWRNGHTLNRQRL